MMQTGGAKASLSVRGMLDGFCRSYLGKTEDPAAISFGFFVNGSDWWTVTIHSEGTYDIESRKPSEPTFYLVSTDKTLEDIFLGKIHFMTAAGRASMRDYAPLDFRFMDGYTPPDDFDLMDFAFHFFVIGEPERIPLGKEYARVVHGGYAIPLMYAKGLRTGWYRVEPDMVINEEEGEQFNPFPDHAIQELELFDFADQRYHDLRYHDIPFGSGLQSGFDDRFSLHLGNLGIADGESTSAVTEHRIDLAQLRHDVVETLVCNAKLLGKLFDFLFRRRQELVQRRVKQAG